MDGKNYKDEYLRYKKMYLDLKQGANNNQSGGADRRPGNFALEDEVYFWGRQSAEHMLFIFLGLQDVDNNNELKNKASEMMRKWKSYMDTNFHDKGIKVSKDRAFLTKEEIEKVRDGLDLKTLKPLIESSIEFKRQLLAIISGGKWIGWVYPALLNHVIGESEYFNRKVFGPEYPKAEEIAYINFHHSDELAVTAQLINPQPDQQAIIDLVRSYVLKKMSVLKTRGGLTGPSNGPFPRTWTAEEEAILAGLQPSDETNLIILSIRFGQEVIDFAKDTGDKLERNEIASIIPLVMAKHQLREYIRLTERLTQMRDL